MKTFLLALLFSLNFLCFADEPYYPLDSPDNTPLFIAIAKGDFQRAETLLENNADLTKKSVKGATIFTALSLNDDEIGSIKFLYKLLKHDIDINIQDDDGDTGLGVAIMRERYFLAQAFLQNEHIDVHKKNNDGLNILHFFYKANFKNPHAHHTLYIALYRGGAKLINSRDNTGKTALHYAVIPGHENIEFLTILVFTPEVHLNIRDYVNGDTPLSILLLNTLNKLYYALSSEEALTSDFFEQVSKIDQSLQILLNPPENHNIDFTLKNNQGLTAYDIILAIHQLIVQLPQGSPLHEAFEPIRKGLSLQTKSISDHFLNSSENTPLFMAISKGDFKTAKILLENGSNPNEKSFKGATIFHALAITDDEQGSIEFLPTLLEYGIDINAQDESGDTGLSIIILAKKYLLAQALLQIEHIDIYKKNNTGENILHIFAYINLDDSPEGIETLNRVLALGGAELINTKNNKGHAPIHYALGYDNIKLLRILVTHPDTDINIEDNNGNVPIVKPLTTILNILRQALLAKEDVTPSYAQIYKINQALQILLESKVDLTIKNHKNLSPHEYISTIKESILKLHKDSAYHLVLEPIIETISMDIENQQ